MKRNILDLTLAIVEVAAATRKMTFRYSGLCGTASDDVDGVRSAIPKGFIFSKLEPVYILLYKQNNAF